MTFLFVLGVLAGCGGLTGFQGSDTVPVSLSGKVTRSDTGAPLAGARVVFAGNKTTTAADGSYQFTSVQVPRQTTVTASLSVALNQFDCVLLDGLTFIAGESAVQNISLVPHPGSGTVTGRTVSLSSSTRTPVAGAKVSIANSETNARATRSANDGTFLVSGLLPGTREMTVTKDGFLTYRSPTEIVDGSTGTIVDLGDIVLTLSGATVTVNGTVKDENGAGIVGATITIGSKSAVSGTGGQFTVYDVTVGLQTVRVTAEGYETFSRTMNITNPPEPLNITLFASGVEPPGTPYNLTGRVTLSDSPDASGVTVSAIERGTSIVQDTTVTQVSGRYWLFVPPSTYTVRATKSHYETQERTVTVPPGGQIVSGVDFALTRVGAASRQRRSRRGH